MRLCSRFVSGKNSGSAGSMTAQRVSTPSSRSIDTSRGSISATPPPRAVEFTIHTVRPASCGASAEACARSSATLRLSCATAA